MGLFTWLFGCKTSNNSGDNKVVLLKEMTSRFGSDGGWNDVFLKITNSTSTDSTNILVCQGLYKGKTVGLQIEIKSNIDAGITKSGEFNSQVGFAHDAVQLKTLERKAMSL